MWAVVRLVLKHALWPLTVLILAWWFSAPLKTSLEGLSEINAGPFRAKLERAAKNQGLQFQTSELAALTMDQLQMFLIVGGEKGQELSVQFKHGATDNLRRDFDALKPTRTGQDRHQEVGAREDRVLRHNREGPEGPQADHGSAL